MTLSLTACSLSLVVLFFPSPSVAGQQSPPPVVEHVVVTANATGVPFEQVTRSVAVITREQIERLPASSIADVLRLVAGVDVRARGGNGVQSDFSIRGASFGQTLVLVDGHRINDAQSGHHNSDIPVALDQVERIEILLGAGSSIHGADAFGGTINVITRAGTDRPTARIGAGQFGSVVASRQVFSGAGRVGIGPSGQTDGFQLAQRSDYIEVEVGLETTLKRGIINTRDEPHADADKHRRLHVIIGDANLAEIATYLKLGTAALVLSMIESGWALPSVELAHPVAAVHQISHDPTLKVTVPLTDGRRLTGLDVQKAYHEAAAKFVAAEYGADVDEQTADVLDRWISVLDRLGGDPLDLADELDWPAKLRLLEGFRSRDGLSWGAHRLALVDLQYADVRKDKGLYNRLVFRGSMKTLVTEEAVLEAMTTPPEDTRAYFRGRCVAKYADRLAAASWDSVIFDIGRDSLVRIPTMEPTRGTKAHVGALLDAADDATELVDALTRQ